MSKNPFAYSFRDLIVYKKSRSTAKQVFGLTLLFPIEERYSLTDQVRRSSRAIGAQIAEAWAKRRYKNHFIAKLTDADGEQNETQHWLEVAADCQYLSFEKVIEANQALQEIGRMLQAMIDRAEDFCGDDYHKVKDSNTSYDAINNLFLNTEH